MPPTIAHWHLVKRFAGTRVGCKCKMCLKKTAIYSQKKLATWKQSSCQGAYIFFSGPVELLGEGRDLFDPTLSYNNQDT